MSSVIIHNDRTVHDGLSIILKASQEHLSAVLQVCSRIEGSRLMSPIWQVVYESIIKRPPDATTQNPSYRLEGALEHVEPYYVLNLTSSRTRVESIDRG